MKKLLLILLGILIAALAFFALKGSEFYKKIYTPNFLKKTQAKSSYNILLFGYGGGAHEGPYLTDTIMLFHVDLKTKKSVLFSIPRDLWLKLPTKSGANFHMKINGIYQLERGETGNVSELYPDLNASHFGAKDDAEFIKFILSQSFGLPIDNYVAMDFEGFKKAVDVLGGVDVNVLKSFEDPQYPTDGKVLYPPDETKKENDYCDKETYDLFKKAEPFLKPGYNPADRERVFKDDSKVEEFVKNATDSPELAFPCRYEKLKFTKGMNHMDGETALKYVRSRHSLQDGSDFGRSARQQQLMKAVKDKVLSVGFVPKIIPLLDELGNHVKTDFSLDDMKKFIGLANTVNDYQLTTYVISDQNLLIDSWSDDGQFILVPSAGVDQWAGFQTSIKNITEGVLPTVTPTVTPSATLK